MANLPGFHFDITGASGSQGLLGPKSSWKAYIFPRGANAAQDSTGTLITFDSAAVAARFAANNWIQAGLSTANIRKVSAVGGNSVAFGGAAMTVSENDRIFLIGTTQPTVTGGSATYTVPNTLIYERDDDASTLITNSMITSNSDGLVEGYAATNLFDVMIQDGNQSNQGFYADLQVGTKPIGDLLPSEDDTWDIGSASLRWQDLFLSGSITGVSAVAGATFQAMLHVVTGTTQQVKLGSDSGATPAGDIHRLGEATMWGSGGESDNAPYKTWGSNTKALMRMRVHLQDGGANEQYNLSTRTNYKGNWSVPQVGVIHETQWHGSDGDVTHSMMGFQSVARDITTTAGGTKPTMDLMVGARGDCKLTDGAAGIITDGCGLQGVGPNQVAGGHSGTITRGSAVMARTGASALTNVAIQMEQGGGIVAPQSLNTGSKAWKSTNNVGQSSSLIHNSLQHGFLGPVNTGFNFRYLDLQPIFGITLTSGTFDANIITTLHATMGISTSDIIPMATVGRWQVRNEGPGTITNSAALDIVAPVVTGAGLISSHKMIRLQSPGTGGTFGTSISYCAHMQLVPYVTGTPATDLSGKGNDGDFTYVGDSSNSTNSGFYGKINGAWYAWTPRGVNSATDNITIPSLANDATPSVTGANMWLTGGTTTITDFDDGVEGQIIRILSEHAVTITDGTNILLAGSANFVMAAGDTLTLVQKADGKWYELARGDN